MLRAMMLLAGGLLASVAHAQAPAADFAGTYAVRTEQGPIVLRIEVTEGRLAGTLAVPGSNPIVLSGHALGRYARGTISSAGDTGEFEALVDGDTLNLRLSQQAQTVPLQLQRVDPSTAATAPGTVPAPTPGPPVSTGAGDMRLVGTWVGQTLVTSGNASMASEEFLVFHADGSYTYGTGRAVAGGSGWSYEGGGGATERGRWRAEDGVFYVLQPDGQWRAVGRYGMTEDGQTMRIIYEGGGRKLWSRRP
jgi:hypothetical protein